MDVLAQLWHEFWDAFRDTPKDALALVKRIARWITRGSIPPHER